MSHLIRESISHQKRLRKHMKRFVGIAFAGVLVFATSACLTMIAYVPQPSTVAAPEKQLENTVNFGVPTPVKVEVTDTFLKAIWINAASGSGPDTKVLNFPPLRR